MFDSRSQDHKVIDFKVQLEIEREAKLQLESLWDEFLESCANAGWDLNRSELQTSGYEIEII